MKGTFTLDGKKYNCEVKNGVRYVNGETIDKFMQGLTIEQLMQFAELGANKMDNPEKSAVRMQKELEGRKYN